jgi:membrane-associated protein
VTPEGLLTVYGGVTILPLAVVEGPIVSVLTGVLSASGYLTWYSSLCLLIFADLIGDAICYAIGRTGGSLYRHGPPVYRHAPPVYRHGSPYRHGPARPGHLSPHHARISDSDAPGDDDKRRSVVSFNFARWLRGRLKPGAEMMDDLKANATKMLLIGKWTHALGCVVLIGCGVVRVPLPRFLLINLLATIPKSALLFGIGFFAAGYFPVLQRHAGLETIVLCAAGILAITLTLRRAATVSS